MFMKRYHLFTLFGFRVGLDLSWFLIATLIVWTLATGYFPSVYEGLAASTYWVMGVFSALGLFFSIIFHEFAHAMVARGFGMPVSGITLFVFGGVAELDSEPPGPRAEGLVAIAGPVSSYVLAGVAYVLARLVPVGDGVSPAVAVLDHLALLNAVLATFNLLPAFPLDGGRVLRAVIWGRTGDLSKATRVSSQLGRMLGGVLMAFGLIGIVTGNFVGGIWQVLIGLFIVGAAGATERHMELQRGLKGLRTRDLMTPDPISIADDVTVARAVEDYFYRYYHKAFPVLRGGGVLGWVRLEDVGALPREEWERTTVGEIVEPGSAAQTASPDAPVLEVLKTVSKAKSGRVMVVADGALVGILTMRDIMDFLTVRLQLDVGPTSAATASRA